MDLRPLPLRASLEEYEKFAQEMLKIWKSGNPEAIQAIKKHHPRLRELSDSEIRSAEFALADAQFIIARVHGFENWPRFAKHIEGLTRDSSLTTVWKSAETALITGDVSTLERLLRENEQLFREQGPPAYGPEPGRLAPDYSGAHARSIIVRNHHFESWARFADYIDALKREDSPIAQFEAAVDAIITGDVATLERLLREHPDLIQARSTRKHHATLLHYVGANGVEDFRQMTPKNAVTVLKVLLEAGAEVDAVADMYDGGCTTLGLVETSVHPLLAGVQDALIETLLVKSLFNEDGSLKANVTKERMKDGFAWACEYGATNVVDFLLQSGMDVSARLTHDGTGLHWAAYGGHVEAVKLLLERKAPVEVKEESFGETPLGWALHAWGEAPPESERRNHYEVVALLVTAGAVVDQEWLADPDREMPLVEKVRGDPRMLAALRGQMSR